jgi:CRP-like cAMP-binding protein
LHFIFLFDKAKFMSADRSPTIPLQILREKAHALMAVGKNEKAAEVCLEIAKSYPQEAGDWGRRAADCFRRVGKIQDEIEALNLAAKGYHAKGLAVKAIAICKAVLSIDATNQITRQLLSQLSSKFSVYPPRPSPTPRTRVTPPAATPIGEMPLGDLLPGAQKTSPKNQPEVFVIPLDDLEFEFGSPTATKERTIISQTPLFSDLNPSCLQQLVEKSRLVDFDHGQVICHQGDPGDDLFVIVEGLAEAVLEYPKKASLGRLKEGEFFGEIALIGGPPRTATVYACGPTRLLLVGRHAIEELIAQEPSILEVVLRFLRNRLLGQLVARIPLFEPCVGTNPNSFASRFQLVQMEEGCTFIQEGTKSKGLFILMSGKAQAFRNDERGEYLVGNLAPGDLCGEMSLLSGSPAAATVRTITRCIALLLPAKDFREAIMTHSQLLDMAATIAEDRRIRNEEITNGRASFQETRLLLI